jgi:hypothetical protein
MNGTADARHALLWRAVVLCVLTMVVLGVSAAQHGPAPGDSSAVDRVDADMQVSSTAADGPSADASVEPGGVSSCGSCDARHRHILRLREADP